MTTFTGLGATWFALIGLLWAGDFFLEGFDFRGKIDDERWRRTWDVANFAGSLVVALVWGVAFTNFAHGLPLTSAGYTGGLLGLLNPLALVGGLAAVAVFTFHGSVFLSLKTSGDPRERTRHVARGVGAAAIVLIAVTIVWVAAAGRPWGSVPGALPGVVPVALAVVAVLLLIGALLFNGRGQELL